MLSEVAQKKSQVLLAQRLRQSCLPGNAKFVSEVLGPPESCVSDMYIDKYFTDVGCPIMLSSGQSENYSGAACL